MMDLTIDKYHLVTNYRDIIARGCLDNEERERYLSTGDSPRVYSTQTSGTSGNPPLKIPRTKEEMSWLGTKLLAYYYSRLRAIPSRVALLGGISHLSSDSKVTAESPFRLKSFRPDELHELDEFDPEIIWLYPSFARELMTDRRLRLRSLAALKLGGEPVLPADIELIFGRLESAAVVEQFGSTEMPGVAFRCCTRGTDTGYELSVDRFAFRLEPRDGWQRLVVKDGFTPRAFPIDGWFSTEDEVFLSAGKVLEVRRHGDPSYALHSEIDAIFRSGVVNLQAWPREGLVYCDWAESVASAPEHLVLGGRSYRVVLERPFRLVQSNKMPLLVDSSTLSRESLWRCPRAGSSVS